MSDADLARGRPHLPRRDPRGIDRVWGAIAIGLPVLVGLTQVTSLDLGAGIRAGQLTLTTGWIPDIEAFTFTAAGTPWLNQQWAAQVLFALVHDLGGWPLLVLLRGALLGVLAAILLRSCRVAGASPRAAALVTLAGFVVAAPNLALRAQLLAVVAFAAIGLLLLERRRHPTALLAVPLLALLWANVHGTFWLAPAAVLVAWSEARRTSEPSTRLATVLVLSAIACLATPWGTGIVGYVAAIGTSPQIRENLTEWQVPVPWAIPGAIYWAAVAGAAVLLVRDRLRPRETPDREARIGLPTLLWLGALAILGATAIRAALWWPVAAAPVVARVVAGVVAARAPRPTPPSMPRPEPRLARGLNVGVIAVLVVLIALALPVDGRSSLAAGPLVDDVPVPAASTVAAALRPGERVFVRQPWAGWFELEAPRPPVFIDSRLELFPPGVVADYRTVIDGGDDALPALERWAVEAVIVQPGDAIAAILRADAGWTVFFEDATLVAFRRLP